jgi:hypothetical protein
MLRAILQQCEIETELEGQPTALQWQPLSIQAAIEIQPRPARARCPRCWGPVRAHNEGVGGKPREHFEHRRAHRGCSWNRKFDGKSRRHPDALE